MFFFAVWQQTVRARLLEAGVLLPLCCTEVLAQASMQPTQQLAQVASVTQTVWGILGYTRWPDSSATLQLCLVGETPYAAMLLASTSLPDGRIVQARRLPLEGSASLDGCHALYAGKLPSGQWQQLMAAWPKAQALLTLSEDAKACRLGGVFCLDVSRDPVRFELSLDSMARSGVRVNPRVLSLSRNKEGS